MTQVIYSFFTKGGKEFNMGEQIYKKQIKSLQAQVGKYRQKVGSIRKENKEYANLIQRFKRLLAENKQNLDINEKKHLIMLGLKKTRKDIEELRNEIKQIQNEMQVFCYRLIKLEDLSPKKADLHNKLEIQNGIAELKQMLKRIHELIEGKQNNNQLTLEPFRKPEKHSNITFRDLQKTAGAHITTEHLKPKDSNIRFSSRQINTELGTAKPPPIRNSDENKNSGEKNNNQPIAEQTKKDSLSLPFLKWKF